MLYHANYTLSAYFTFDSKVVNIQFWKFSASYYTGAEEQRR